MGVGGYRVVFVGGCQGGVAGGHVRVGGCSVRGRIARVGWRKATWGGLGEGWESSRRYIMSCLVDISGHPGQ